MRLYKIMRILRKRSLSIYIILVPTIIFFSTLRASGGNKKDAYQEIEDFSFVEYRQGENERLRLNGRFAQLQNDVLHIDNISALSFGRDKILKLKAEEGDFNKIDNILYLTNNVTVTTTDGTVLMTDRLNWDVGTKTVSTDSSVHIKKSDMEVDGERAFCNLGEEFAKIEEDIRVTIPDVEIAGIGSGTRPKKTYTIITCDGPLELDYRKSHITFYKNVKVEDARGNIIADRVDVYLRPDTRRARCIVCRGNVRIITGENITYSDKAIYLVEEGRVILPHKPRLMIGVE